MVLRICQNNKSQCKTWLLFFLLILGWNMIQMFFVRQSEDSLWCKQVFPILFQYSNPDLITCNSTKPLSVWYVCNHTSTRRGELDACALFQLSELPYLGWSFWRSALGLGQTGYLSIGPQSQGTGSLRESGELDQRLQEEVSTTADRQRGNKIEIKFERGGKDSDEYR